MKKKIQILMNKPVSLGLSILEIQKIVMHEFCYDYLRSKYGEKAKLCCMDTDSSLVYVRAENTSSEISKDFQTSFDISNYKLDKPLAKGKNKKVIGLVKDELSEKIMREFIGLREKSYSYLRDNNDEDKKVEGTKKCVIKRKLKFEYYKNCLEAT